jgi:hypothetical protein
VSGPIKPVGMTPEEEWLWDNTAPGSWQRRMLARHYKERLKAPLYVRFGDPPRADARYGGRSLAEGRGKKENPRLERGVSCFRGYWAADGALVVDVSKSPAQLEMYKMVVREGRPVYLLTGREAAQGSDGEPVLTDAEYELVPVGTRVRCSGHWQEFSTRIYNVWAVASLGLMGPPAWARESPPEMAAAGPKAVAPRTRAVTDAPSLLEAVLARSTIKDSGVHGEAHWKRVAVAGARLAEGTPGADRLVVFLFALLHDSQRVYEGYDAWPISARSSRVSTGRRSLPRAGAKSGRRRAGARRRRRPKSARSAGAWRPSRGWARSAFGSRSAPRRRRQPSSPRSRS